MYLTKSKAKFTKYGGAIFNRPKPCTENEIQSLEKNLDCQISEAYREFLLWMGHGAGKLFRGTHIFYKDLIDIQEWAAELLAENEFPEKLSDDAIVCMMHQGYQFMFFRTSEGNDPQIYYYNEGYHTDSFELLFQNLDQFLVAQLDAEIG